jgi:hypothetical protein
MKSKKKYTNVKRSLKKLSILSREERIKLIDEGKNKSMRRSKYIERVDRIIKGIILEPRDEQQEYARVIREESSLRLLAVLLRPKYILYTGAEKEEYIDDATFTYEAPWLIRILRRWSRSEEKIDVTVVTPTEIKDGITLWEHSRQQYANRNYTFNTSDIGKEAQRIKEAIEKAIHKKELKMKKPGQHKKTDTLVVSIISSGIELEEVMYALARIELEQSAYKTIYVIANQHLEGTVFIQEVYPENIPWVSPFNRTRYDCLIGKLKDISGITKIREKIKQIKTRRWIKRRNQDSAARIIKSNSLSIIILRGVLSIRRLTRRRSCCLTWRRSRS